MWLKQIEIHNFRNIKKATLEFASRLNIISGANAQGKTNFLEALYCLLKGRSFRTSYEHECQSIPPLATAEENITLIKGALQKQEVSHSVRYVLSGEIKRLYFDDKVVERLTDYWRQTPVVVFTPDDLNIVKGPPVGRRRFLDILASQLWQAFINTLQNFNALLKRRNNLLRRILNGDASPVELEPWDERLSSLGAEIFSYRCQLVEKLNHQAVPIFSLLSQGKESLSLAYENFLGANSQLPLQEAQQLYLDMLLAQREIDLERGITTSGPQRDDLLISINGLDCRSFSSQGQFRAVMISLRCAEAQLLTGFFSAPPILLLDDILSELDSQHRDLVPKMFPVDSQIFLTTTELNLPAIPEAFDVFLVDEGNIVKISKTY